MAKNSSNSASHTQNNNVITINRNLFLAVFGIMALLVGVAIGFWLGQYATTRNLSIIQGELVAGLQELSLEPQVFVEPQVDCGDTQIPQAVEPTAAEDIPVDAEDPLLPEVPDWQEVSVDECLICARISKPESLQRAYKYLPKRMGFPKCCWI